MKKQSSLISILFICIFAFITMATKTWAQCTCFTVSVPPVKGCAGDIKTVTPAISGTYSYTSSPGCAPPQYNWSAPAGSGVTFSSTNTLATNITLPPTSTVCTLKVTGLCGNIVCNGNFESGAGCFSSSYGTGTCEGNWELATNPNPPYFCSFGDHTSGSGYMMCINGNATGGCSCCSGFDGDFYKTNVSLCMNTWYYFSVYARPTGYYSAGQQPNINVGIGGTTFISGFILGTVSTSCDPGWTKIEGCFYSTSSGTFSLHMWDNNTARFGNDFAIDDVNLQPYQTSTVPVPLTVTPAPTYTITPIIPATCIPTPCPSTVITFDITTSGSAIDYNTSTPASGSTPYIDISMPGSGTLPVPLSAGTPGNVCVGVTKIYSQGCVFPITDPPTCIDEEWPTAVITSDHACVGQDFYLHFTGPSGGILTTTSSPAGIIPGSIVLDATGHADVLVPGGISGTTTFYINSINNGCCIYSPPIPISITVTPDPVPTISLTTMPNPVCLGESFTLSVNCPTCVNPFYSIDVTAGSSTYTATITSPATSTTLTAAGSSETFLTSGTNSYGCSSPATLTVPVTAPTENITYALPPGCLFPCPGTPVTFTINGLGGDIVSYITYSEDAGTWSSPATITIPGPIGTPSSYTLSTPLSTSIPGNVCVRITDIQTGTCDFPMPGGPVCVDEEYPSCDLQVMVYNPATGTYEPGMPCGTAPYRIQVSGNPGDYYISPDWGTPFTLTITGTSPGSVMSGDLYVNPSTDMNTYCVSKIVTGCCTVLAASDAYSGGIPLCCIHVIAKDVPQVYLETGPACSGRPFNIIIDIYNTGEPVTHPNTIAWSRSCDGWTDLITPHPGTMTGATSPYLEDENIETVPGIPTTSPCNIIVSVTGDNGCVTTETVTVTPGVTPAPITGPSTTCANGEFPIMLSDADPGGTWSATPPVAGTIDPLTGLFSGVSGGTATVSYTLPNHCFITSEVTVNPVAPIWTDLYLCSPCETEPLFPADPLYFGYPYPAEWLGGTWSSSNPTILTVPATPITNPEATGQATATCDASLLPASATIIYTLPTGCYSTLTVNVLPSVTPITGTPIGCGPGSTLTLSDASPYSSGGGWSSLDPSIATVTSSGLVTFTGTGTTLIYYDLNPEYGDVMFPYTDYASCSAQYTVSDAAPNVSCYGFQDPSNVWHLGFTAPSFPSSGLSVTYTADLVDPSTSTVYMGISALPAYEPLSIMPGNNDVLPSYFGLSSSYLITHIYLTAVNYGACTWSESCTSYMSKPGHTTSSVPQSSAGVNTVSIVPNPNNGIFTIKGEFTGLNKSEVQLEVIDVLGQTVLTDVGIILNGTLNKNIRLGDNIASGMYYLRIRNNDINEVIKFSLKK